MLAGNALRARQASGRCAGGCETSPGFRHSGDVRVGGSLFVDLLRTDEFVILASAAEHVVVQPCR